MKISSFVQRFFILVLLFGFVLSTPLSAIAASSDLEVSGWIPYWRTEAGTDDAIDHIDQFTEVNPFAYSVRSNGTLSDTLKITEDEWEDLIDEARDADVRVIPTVMWSDTDAMYTVLSNPRARAAHVESIMDEVEKHDFDGIDIDYEGKSAETRDAYSAFLLELATELQEEDKWLQCTIESRMPLSARFSGTPPANIEYANDLPKINQYCDRVRIMTYDQQTADLELNRKYEDEPYAPVSDTEWVEKVVEYMDNDIDRDKMMIGVPTYGYIWQVMPKLSGDGFTYIKVEAFNPGYGVDVAEEYDIEPARGASGELAFTYVPDDSPDSLPSQRDLERRAPRNTESAWLALEGAKDFTDDENRQAPVNYLTWSDADAIEQKIELAEDLGVAGVAIFKIDGGVDPDMWDVLPEDAVKELDVPSKRLPEVSTPSAPSAPTSPQNPSTPAGISTSFSNDLELGDNNADVLRLQRILAAQGHLTATPNGNFGPATLAAVRAWQSANGVSATGYFGPLSRAEMARTAPSSAPAGDKAAQLAELLAQLQMLKALLEAVNSESSS